ncbi:Serpin domain containing protein, partial [Asbolus verrucosus]
QVVKDNPNFLISPYAVEMVLAFVRSGCKGEAAREIRHCFHLGDNDTIKSFAEEWLSVLEENDKYTLHMANKLYVKTNFQINEGFKRAATEKFKSDVENIDFVPKTKAADTMNGWVERQTNKKIKNLISSDIFDETTRAMIINALYFKGNWSTQRKGLRSLEDQIEDVIKHRYFREAYVDVDLPKFKIENTLNLKGTLRNLGISKAFDGKDVDLSGIAGKEGDLIVSDVVQKTFISVEEGGVETNASTCRRFTRKLVEPRFGYFIADHPFIFYIRANDVIIFIGRVSAPSH